ncbi:MAG TPA: hypothetical protein VIL85_02990 [Thermomicrobiales bacterium]
MGSRVPLIHPPIAICDVSTGAHTPNFAATLAEVLLRRESREALRAGFREQSGGDPEE